MILLLHKTKEGKLTNVAENEIDNVTVYGLKPFNVYDIRSFIELPLEKGVFKQKLDSSKGLVLAVILSIPFWLLFTGILILV